jgi:hypothetical protein
MPNKFSRKVVLHSVSGYSEQHDRLINEIIDDGVLLFCSVGKDCELWHDVVDEIIVGDGQVDRGDMVTTWHDGESLDEVIVFAEGFDIGEEFSGPPQIITV